MRRILHATHSCYVDDSSGASVASRALLKELHKNGFPVEVLCGNMLDVGRINCDETQSLATIFGLSSNYYQGGFDAITVNSNNELYNTSTLNCHVVDGIKVWLHSCPSPKPHFPNRREYNSFLGAFENVRLNFKPEIVIGYGGDPIVLEIFKRSRYHGIKTVFVLHNFSYWDIRTFDNADVVFVPSAFAAMFYKESLGLDCVHLPNIIDKDRILIDKQNYEKKYVTFVNPSYEKGVYPFARIADEIGRRRPDVKFLVVEGRGTERTVADCGLNLTVHGTIFFMPNTYDPKQFLTLTKFFIMPSLWCESQGLVAVEALINGIPVIGSDRGALPETIGGGGVILPLPGHLTPATRNLPSIQEIESWVNWIIHLWDDKNALKAYSNKGLAEAQKWFNNDSFSNYLKIFL